MKAMKNKNYDIVVIGAGVSGICAAVAAARMGSKVALLHDRPVPGGNSSSEVGVQINGACYNAIYSPSVYARETGVVEEIKQLLYHYDKGSARRRGCYDAAFLDIIYAEKNIDLYLNTLAIDAKLADGSIESVYCVQLGSEREYTFGAKIFIDASGDGHIAHRAGAEFMQGREGKAEYDESLAPETADSYTHGHTIMFYSSRSDRKVEYVRPKFAHDITKLPFFKDLGSKHRLFHRASDGSFNGLWWIEYGGQLDTIYNNEDITLELRKLVYGFWDYIKNSGDFEDVDNLVLERVCPVPGKRESRRFVGDYVLSQNDIAEKREFHDACFVGGWPMDVHAPKGIYDDGFATHWNFVEGMYNIPFRTLYSKNVPNLLFAGRNISCTQVAFGSTRVSGTCGASGQASGTAAHLCVKHGCFPRGVYEKHIAELQSLLLRQDQTILGMRREVKGFHFAASGESRFANFAHSFFRPLDVDSLIAFPAKGRLNSVKMRFENKSSSARTLKYSVMKGRRKENYLPELAEKERSVNLPSGVSEQDLLLDSSRGEDGKIYLLLLADEHIFVSCAAEELTGVPCFTVWKKKPDARDTREYVLTRIRDSFAFDCAENAGVFAPQNLAAGYMRPYGLPNIFVSNGKENSWLAMRTDSPRDISEIQLIFNTDLQEDIIYNRCKKTVRDYDLVITTGGGEVRLEKRGNFDRVNSFFGEFKAVTEIKIEFMKNWGSENFELYGIAVY